MNKFSVFFGVNFLFVKQFENLQLFFFILVIRAYFIGWKKQPQNLKIKVHVKIINIFIYLLCSFFFFQYYIIVSMIYWHWDHMTFGHKRKIQCERGEASIFLRIIYFNLLCGNYWGDFTFVRLFQLDVCVKKSSLVIHSIRCIKKTSG